MEHLLTIEGEKVSKTPWNVYPRPQLKRENWLCLNGEWDLSFGPKEPSYDEKVLVPFCVESRLSGINRMVNKKDVLFFKREVVVPKEWEGKTILLHFGAVSQYSEIFWNGKSLGTHSGGYHPFSFDITSVIEEKNELVLRVTNPVDRTLPTGKQTIKRGGIWYTPTTGPWQTVWLEPVEKEHIEKIKIDIEDNGVKISIVGPSEGAIVLLGKEYPIENGICKIELDNPHKWTPEDPYLYEFTIRAGMDQVESYFAYRKVSIEKIGDYSRICLNGEPYFFNGLLDQGYYSDGIYTPADETLYEQDILRMKKLGFNTLRKHIKIEPEIFYYDCDRLGMIVFQDMVNIGVYSFFHDTALPFLFPKMKRKDTHCRFELAKIFKRFMKETVELLYNHPSIVYWTIFNEGWGQTHADDMYALMRTFDTSRIIDATSGWVWQKDSDVDSHHIYFREIKMTATERPLVLSEFGGYTLKVEGHSFNLEKTTGYKDIFTREDFVKQLRRLFEEEVIPHVSRGLCASIYTQVSDVEDEVNGLLTYDRKVEKVLPDEFSDIGKTLQNEIRK